MYVHILIAIFFGCGSERGGGGLGKMCAEVRIIVILNAKSLNGSPAIVIRN